MGPDSYISVASILSGFGVTVLMFRIQRELDVRENHPEWPNWLAWADYLILLTITISLLFVVLPLVAINDPGKEIITIAAASCSASVVLLAGYPFAILAHYRLEIGKNREGARDKGEPIERVIVILSCLFAGVVFIWVYARVWA